ncbi:hypothetical protein CAEBREN_05418 [Caenorhabditis brenneri]|uniref:Uncharacterized protein n=1 Tax=Caenorhabditis brenneri TaxID=135651 RepID=G0N255_CAEBE|nr:hypothetical protein CAEBREN_05418 [Caenorhabditis brenneri]
MSRVKDHQKPEETVNANETNDLKAQVEQLQAEAAGDQAQIQQLKEQLKEAKEQKIIAQINNKVDKALVFLYDDKFRIMEEKLKESEELRIQAEAKVEAQINESEGLRIQAQEFFGKLWRESERQAQEKLQESEGLRIRALEELEACKSKFEVYKAHTHRTIVSLQYRCSELEGQMVCLTGQAQVKSQALQQAYADRIRKLEAGFQAKLAKAEARQAGPQTEAEAEVQVLLQALADERASHSAEKKNQEAQLTELNAMWSTMYNKDVMSLKDRLAEAKARWERPLEETQEATADGINRRLVKQVEYLRVELEQAKRKLEKEQKTRAQPTWPLVTRKRERLSKDQTEEENAKKRKID